MVSVIFSEICMIQVFSMDDFKLNYEINPDPKDLQFLDDEIFENSFLKIGKYSYQNLAFFFREKTLKIISSIPPDHVLLDNRMPGIDGYKTCSRLK